MTDRERPLDPASGVDPEARSRADGAPPRPPGELDPDPTEVREFMLGEEKWIACVAGKGAAGTGAYGLGMVEAVHFARADAPGVPLREALLPRGRFLGLFDEELRELFGRATPIVQREPPQADGGGRSRA